MTNFQLEDFTQRGGRLLNQTRDIFNRYGDLRNSDDKPICDVETLPNTMQPADGAIKLVFVGQYSSGKSSLIKMLTGENVKIGAAITTDAAKEYTWGELEVVDTPGIQTGVRPDHDEKAYYQIDHAALLIFVVTNEGFDDYIGNHFRKLAVEQKRGKNMVLVVNKMDRSRLGNVAEQQQIIKGDMLKVITPYTPEDLFMSFVAAEMYLEGLNESDPELRDIYFEQSGHDQFVDNLNKFVASRGVLAKVQAPLETLKKAITNVTGDADKRLNAKDFDDIEEILRRKKRRIDEGKRRVKIEIERLAATCANEIRAEGSHAASSIDFGVTEEEAQNILQTAQSNAEIHVKNCESEMVARLGDILSDVESEMNSLDHSPLAIELKRKLNLPTDDGMSEKIDGATFGKSLASNIELIGTKSKAASAMGINVSGLVNVNFSSVVKNVGHLFGVKFAPWGAVNIVKNASKALGLIGMAYQAYQLIDKVFGEDKEAKAREELRKAKEEIRNSFNDAADAAQQNIIEAATNNIDQLTAPQLREINDGLDSFSRQKSRLAAVNQELTSVLNDVDELMDEVQKTARA